LDSNSAKCDPYAGKKLRNHAEPAERQGEAREDEGKTDEGHGRPDPGVRAPEPCARANGVTDELHGRMETALLPCQHPRKPGIA
jgi:hypothetical protein